MMAQVHAFGVLSAARRVTAARLLVVAMVSFSLMLVGCQTYNVQTDWDPSISFDGFERFIFVVPPEVKGGDPFVNNSLLRKRVRFAVESELAEQGYERTGSREEADFAVTYTVLVDERLRVDGVSSTGTGFHRRGTGLGHGYSMTNVRTFHESTLILDFLSPENDELLWRGWGTGIVRTRDRDRGDSKLTEGVTAILNHFPPETRTNER